MRERDVSALTSLFVRVLFHCFVNATFEILDRVSIEFQRVMIFGRHGVSRCALFSFGQRRQERRLRLVDVRQR